MHFYRFNIKDYAVNTTHLTNEEDLAYRRLLDLYYTDEQPIPNNNQLVSRRIRIAAEVVNVVLNEFFVLTENGWICGRVEEEIEGYRNLCRKRKEVGASGGRPPKKQAKPKGKQEETNRLAIAPIPLTTNQYISPIVPSGDNEEISTPEKEDPILGRFRGLFRIRDTSHLDSSTLRAWIKNKKAAAGLNEEEWRVLEWVYRQTEGAAAQFRRRDLATLLNNLTGEIARGRDWAAKQGVSFTVGRRLEQVEPDGWQDIITDEDASYNCTTWAALPDSMKSYVRQKIKEREAVA
jgi:uncharacterized protein YdaU (DUF1376 family)